MAHRLTVVDLPLRLLPSGDDQACYRPLAIGRAVLTQSVQGSPWFERLYRASIDIPGPEVAALAEAARAASATVVIGVNERDPFSMGTLYNSLVFLGPDGTLLGVHRKLVPTWAEKLTWAGGAALMALAFW